ncbi:MAG: DNA repair protein RecN [Proteobacteria bacterium]|nr:DNA repair protein RecN [Pseudomonadota bacterium]
MLTALAIRDVVLIERLDLAFGPGLTVLTGETGTGKSILLDSLGLALGARADQGLVRRGAAQASVTACFAVAGNAPLAALLDEQGMAAEDDLVIRRVVAADGKSRAFLNDEPVGVGLLRRVAALLVEVQGQHDQMGLADASTHAGLLDAYGVAAALRVRAGETWRAWQSAREALREAESAAAAAARDEDWLRHAVDELAALAPRADEEETLAEERRALQQAERRGEAIAAASSELAPRDRRSGGPAAALRAASRALLRLVPPNGTTGGEADGSVGPVLAALDRAENALAEAETLLTRLAAEADADPRRLEQAEERLFALRAAARKHGVTVPELAGLLDQLSSRLALIESGAEAIAAAAAAEAAARGAYEAAAGALTAARQDAAARFGRAIAKELPPLRLDKARFVVSVAPLAEEGWGPNGADAVRFLVATNPGQEPGPLARIASGGELSRLMLALKVVLSAGSAVPTLVFDEVDAGLGGATAAAVGERLARVAERVQVLVVTHSPQVAARGAAHLRVAKASGRGKAETRVDVLASTDRREEIARMLSGETVTEAARAAADALLEAGA